MPPNPNKGLEEVLYRILVNLEEINASLKKMSETKPTSRDVYIGERKMLED